MQLRRSKKTLIIYTFSLLTLIFSASFPALALAGGGASTWWIGSDSELLGKIKNLPTEPITEVAIPVLGVKVSDLVDTWGDARSNGRRHEGIDILAPRGTFVVSPTVAVVTRIDYGPLGGIVVYTANPGSETYYYAHLDGVSKDLEVGDIIAPGELIGYVGDTGNARGTVTHLHFTIFNDKNALNPYPRLTKEFTNEEQSIFTEKITADGNKDVPQNTLKLNRNLKEGMHGSDVGELQEFLIEANSGPQARALAKIGATRFFGKQTKKALAEYQLREGIVPAQGYLGEKTKAHLNKVALVN